MNKIEKLDQIEDIDALTNINGVSIESKARDDMRDS